MQAPEMTTIVIIVEALVATDVSVPVARSGR